ncbi:MAG TPA: glycosyltransferase [Candidatus Dormibacteraeota bacterium]|nr:glycosyltransferase [Candidatus Dormibacteraeota bacterium]
MQFSVVIATRDRERYLRTALASLQAQAGAPPFEVVVVDNGSTDGTKGVVAEYAGVLQAVRYVAAPQPNRGQARNRGVAAASGRYVLFCDDDVEAPTGWIAAHAAAQRGGDRVVNGPILNVPSLECRPKPTAANYSRAFLCTCNASLSRAAFTSAGGFDEGFDLYGWEDTELGVRLRSAGLRWTFAWDAYLWHLKPPQENTLAVEARKAVEKARMATRFLAKHPSRRAQLATGAHALNLIRARYLLPDWLVAIYAGLSTSESAPAWIAALGRAQFLDAIYSRELVRALDGR